MECFRVAQRVCVHCVHNKLHSRGTMEEEFIEACERLVAANRANGEPPVRVWGCTNYLEALQRFERNPTLKNQRSLERWEEEAQREVWPLC